MTKVEITRVIQWCRSNFWNDGAEGESVHALCDYIEGIHATQESALAVPEIPHELGEGK